MAQQHAYGNGVNLARSYVPTMLVAGLLIVGIPALIKFTWDAASWWNKQEQKERTVGERLDGVDRSVGELRQDIVGMKASQSRIEQAIKELPRGGWHTEMREAKR